MDDPQEPAAVVRRRAVLTATRARTGPLVVAVVNLSQLKAYNAIVGHAAGDQLLGGVGVGLGRLGETWRVRGDEFVCLLDGGLVDARTRLRAFTWLYHVRVGATDAWELDLGDGRPAPIVPHLHLEIVCTPRVGHAALAEADGDAERALALAEERCARAAVDAELHAAYGFAPLGRSPWPHGLRLAEATCPRCASPAITVVDADLGARDERCDACGASYRRVDKTFVLGRAEGAGYA